MKISPHATDRERQHLVGTGESEVIPEYTFIGNTFWLGEPSNNQGLWSGTVRNGTGTSLLWSHETPGKSR